MAEDARDKIVRYLDDAYAAEQGGIKSLEAMAGEATDPDLKAAYEQHLQETRQQAEMLSQRIRALGGNVNAGKSVMDSLLSIGSHFTNIFHDKEDKQTQDLVKAAALEEFEVCTYTSLKAYANAVGDYETAQMADQILGQEQLTRERLERLVPRIATLALNKTAGAGTAGGAAVSAS